MVYIDELSLEQYNAYREYIKESCKVVCELLRIPPERIELTDLRDLENENYKD